MRRNIAFCVVTLLLGAGLANLVAAPALPGSKAGGVFVLDDCDPDFRGKEKYADNLSYIDGTGKLVFRVSGLNCCQSVGCSRHVAYDRTRGHVWVIENVGRRVLKFDLDGKELLAVKGVQANAAAVDPATGNLWVLHSDGTIYGDKTIVLSPEGKELAVHDIAGFDIAYDAKSKAFWVVNKRLLKVDLTGKPLVRTDLAEWCCSSLDVHTDSGRVWVTALTHPDVPGSKNELIGLDTEGKVKHRIDFGKHAPFHTRVDPRTGSVWVADFRTSVRRYSPDGELKLEKKIEALGIHPDPATGDLWVVTPDETVRMTEAGAMTKQVKHTGPTLQAWVAGP
jgi:DNA-binding beta-propeller fold protein YncE